MIAPLALIALLAAADSPPELGSLVRFERDLDAALASAKSSGKPVFLLFQEVPGCATCVGFGRDVLSHPLLAEAIQEEFVAAAVYNSTRGDSTPDGRALARFSEAAFNNPVVRFVDAMGKDVLPRRDGVYTPFEIADRMVRALEASRRGVPAYLRLALLELDESPPTLATFVTSCFWEGEARLGGIPGVRRTRVGFLDGAEVVEVAFDARTLPLERLVGEAKKMDCVSGYYVHETKLAGGDARLSTAVARDAPDSDRKHALARSPLRFLPLTEAQASRLNAAVAVGTGGSDGLEFLTPRQRRLAAKLLAARPEALDGLAVPARTIEAFDGAARALEDRLR